MVFLATVAKESRGKVGTAHVYGGFNMAFSLAAFIGPIVSGQILQTAGIATGFKIQIGLSAALSLGCAPLTWMYMVSQLWILITLGSMLTCMQRADGDVKRSFRRDTPTAINPTNPSEAVDSWVKCPISRAGRYATKIFTQTRLPVWRYSWICCSWMKTLLTNCRPTNPRQKSLWLHAGPQTIFLFCREEVKLSSYMLTKPAFKPLKVPGHFPLQSLLVDASKTFIFCIWLLAAIVVVNMQHIGLARIE